MRRGFKVSLGRASFTRPSAPVAVLISGGMSSAAAASLYAHYLAALPPHPTAPAPVTILVHVPISPATSAAAASLAAHLNFPLHSAPLPRLLAVRDASDASVLHHARVIAAARDAAILAGAKRVITGTTADRAAVDVLSRVFTGCGPAVGDAAAAELHGMLRPLLHVSMRNAVRYVRIVTIGGVEFASGATAPAGKMNLRAILERFVEDSQDENESCIHNIVRTAGRLSPSAFDAPACALCGLACGSNADLTRMASHATEESTASAFVHNADKVEPFSCGEGDTGCEGCGCSDGKEGDMLSGVQLCYSCKAAVERAGGVSGGGKKLLSDALGYGRRREAMRESIQEFLLPDGDE
jgi:Cytoplasmic tRNA 2-thiolation protein 2